MKDAVLTIRLPSSLRRKVEKLARLEGRSLSQEAGRLILHGIEGQGAPTARRRRPSRPLSGIFTGSRVPTLAEFREVRTLVSRSLGKKASG